MLRGMAPKSRYSGALGVLFLSLTGTSACSDDKPAKSGQAEQSTGGESSFKSRVDQAHENFKQGIQPAAGWVDDRSHEVADEAERAVNKGKKTLSGDDDQTQDHTAQ